LVAALCSYGSLHQQAVSHSIKYSRGSVLP
jgi:hypothetical protein